MMALSLALDAEFLLRAMLKSPMTNEVMPCGMCDKSCSRSWKNCVEVVLGLLYMSRNEIRRVGSDFGDKVRS